jgi:3-hydroxybutyryl-CoA dehydrogenase
MTTEGVARGASGRGAAKDPAAGKVLVAGEGPLAEDLAAVLSGAGRPVALYLVGTGGVGPSGVEHVTDLAVAAADAAVALETLCWPVEGKRELVGALDRGLPERAVLASLCTANSTTEIATWTGRRSQVVGFGLVPPLDAGKLVEIAPGLETDESATLEVAELFTAAGREVARVRDDVGLVLGRVVCLIVNEAASMLMEEVASARDIDTAMKLGANYPRGALEWADLMGIDFVYATLLGLQAEQGEDRYRPCPLLRRMVLAGRLGRKSGRGFYEYAPD